MNILEWLYARKLDETDAIVTETESITYKELYQYSIAMAEIIKKNIQMDSENIGLFAKNNINYIIGYFGILFSGKCVVPIKKNSSLINIKDTLKRANTIYMLTDDMLMENEMSLIFIKREKKDNICIECRTSTNMLLLETTGTTGGKKLVRMTEENICFVVTAYTKAIEMNKIDKIRFFILVPLQSAYGNYVFLSCISIGATIILYENFVPWNFRNIVLEKKVTHIECISTLLLSITKIYSQTEWGDLRYIGFGGERIHNEVEVLLSTFPGIQISQGYGLTEAGPLITVFPPKLSIDDINMFREKINSVGKILPGVTVKIDVKNLAKVGEILVAGPNITKGYYNEDNNLIFNNGFLKTGDLGYFDQDDYLYITGRIKNIAIIEGNNVQIEEVESIIRLCPKVQDVRVFTVKDAFTGERLQAEVVAQKDLSEYELRKFIQNRLEVYKLPSNIFFVETIKKVDGKIKR